LINGDDTHGPAGKTVRDMTVIVYPVGKEFLLAAEYPISSVTMPDAERLIEPSFSFKDADKALKCIMRLISGSHVIIGFLWSVTSAREVNKMYLNVKGYLGIRDRAPLWTQLNYPHISIDETAHAPKRN
jgi:hypothetical protein